MLNYTYDTSLCTSLERKSLAQFGGREGLDFHPVCNAPVSATEKETTMIA